MTHRLQVAWRHPLENVDALEHMGIPATAAPEYWRKWRDFHSKGEHRKCFFFPKISQYLGEGMDFRRAEAMIEGEMWAEEFNDQEFARETGVGVNYRFWESQAKLKAWDREYEERNIRSPARLKHVDDIRKVLIKLLEQIEAARSSRYWDLNFSVEQHLLFDNMLQHCKGVQGDFEQFSFRREAYEEKEKALISKIAGKKSSGMNDNFVPAAVRYAVIYGLYRSLPTYDIEPGSGLDWRVFIWKDETKIVIGEGDFGLDIFKSKHLDLIHTLKRDPAIKGLIELRKEFSGLLKALEKQVVKALDNKEHLIMKTFCPDCPQYS